MKHPLDFLPVHLRKPFFFSLLALTLILFAVLNALDKPLRTPTAPHGIVSFELAGSPEAAAQIIGSWTRTTTGFPDDVPIFDSSQQLYAAFGLGLDYLFMPAYTLALALGILVAANKHSGWIQSISGVAGWGAIAAALFDAVENYALWRVLTGETESSYPQIAAVCATAKFGLILAGLLYALIAWIYPKRTSP